MFMNKRYIAVIMLVALVGLMSLSAMETRAAETVFTYDDLGRLAKADNLVKA